MNLFRKSATALVFTYSLAIGGHAMAQDLQQDNKRLLADFGAEVFGKKEFTNLHRYMREDYVQHNPLVPQGSTGFKQFFADWFGAVPDWDYHVTKIVAEGDTVWAYGTYSGTQQGDWLGIPATHQSYRIAAVDIFRIQDGKLAEHWDVIDIYGLFKQLGVIK
jgi:steroid delta-isomerase-like uncharacterized protein